MGPNVAETLAIHSERCAARQTFLTAKAKRPLSGESRAGSTVFNGLAALHKTCPKRGVQAAAAPGGLSSPGSPASVSERRGAGRRSENDARRGTYFAGPVRLRALRAALSFARFLRRGYRLPRRAVLWYNMST